MKTNWIQAIFLLLPILLPRLASAQSIEISQEFKEVIEVVAREDFRNYLFNQIAKNDPCMAIVTYDLLGEIITSRDYKGISDLIIDSSVDYLFLSNTKSAIEKYLVEKEKEQWIFKTRGGSEVKLSGETRERFISFSALYWYSVQRQHNNLPIPLPLYELLRKHKDEYDLVLSTTSNRPSEYWTKRILRTYVKTSFRMGIDTSESEYYKQMIKELMHKQDKWEERILAAYSIIQKKYENSKQKKYTETETAISSKEAHNEMTSSDTFEESDEEKDVSINRTSVGEFEGYDTLESSEQVTAKFKKDFKNQVKKISNKVKIDVDNMNPNMIFSVSYSYINNLLYYNNEFSSHRNDQKMVDDIFDMLCQSEQRYSRERLVKVKFGLWGGVFSGGPKWYDDNGNLMSYPITQLKINDRFQLSPLPRKAKDVFIYAGGLTDTLFGNLLNKNSKTFIYVGLGYQYKQWAFCYSLAIPSNFHDQSGGVASIMYDIDLSRIIRILRK